MKRRLIYHSHVSPNSPQTVITNVVSDDNKVSCLLDKISRDGLTLCCDATTLQMLMPNKSCVSVREPISVETCFHFKDTCSNQNLAVHAVSRIVFARRLSKNEYLMELKFTDISEQDASVLNNYIRHSLSPNQEKASINHATDITKKTSSRGKSYQKTKRDLRSTGESKNNFQQVA